MAEFDYQPGKCSRSSRVGALRKNISKMKGEHVLFDEIRYFFSSTTRPDLSAADIVACANERGDQENIIEQLKNGVKALRRPVYDLVSNWADMVMATLAWNIKSWFALMMHLQRDRDVYIRMEFRRFMNSLILIPCRVVRRARSLVIRILGYQPTLDRLGSAWNTIERTGFGSCTRDQPSDGQVAERAIPDGSAVKRENSSDPHDGSVWFWHKWLAGGRSGHRPSPDGTTTVKNGQEIKTRLFEG